MTIHTPATEAEAVDVVREARARRTPFAIVGGGTRQRLGRPVAMADTLSTAALTGITLHEPAEMVIAAQAGTPLAEIERALAATGQMLPFEPMDHRALYASAGEPTIGAIAAANIAGPRRIRVGAARDHLIGVRCVNGRGEAVKSGGRVMKNVTGLDLVKLMSGAYGTLGLLTEVTFKVLPQPQATGTLVIEGLDDARAGICLAAALASPFEVSGAAHLPAGVTGGVARTLLRIEHFPESVAYRLDALEKLLALSAPTSRLDRDASAQVWRDIRDVQFFAAPDTSVIWRISVAPTRAAGVVAQIAQGCDARWFYDWGGGLVWLATAASEDAGSAQVRAAIAPRGGHATLVRAPNDVRLRVDVFEPLTAPLTALTRGIKASVDPDGLFNPGRMYAGV